jgi:hypothetical protein
VILGRIYEGLEDMDIDEVAEQQDDEFPKLPFRRAIAGLLVQPHDYIIRAGTEIEVLSTGEADIYLRIGEFRDASVPPLFQREMLGTSPAGTPNQMAQIVFILPPWENPSPSLSRRSSCGLGIKLGDKKQSTHCQDGKW